MRSGLLRVKIDSSIPNCKLKASLPWNCRLSRWEWICNILPIDISEMQLFTDSMISLHWLNSYNYKLDKMNKQTVFVLNRLEHISRQCSKFVINFSFVATSCNPADCLSRALSHKQLLKTNYIRGPSFLRGSTTTSFDVTIPNPVSKPNLDMSEPESVEVSIAE